MEQDLIEYKNWVKTHILDLTKICKIVGNGLWEDLLQSSILHIYNIKKIPPSVIYNSKEYQYSYTLIRNLFYTYNGEFIKKNTYNTDVEYDSDKINLDSYFIEKKNYIIYYNNEIINTNEDELQDIVYVIYLDELKRLKENKSITDYDFKIFILKFYQDEIINYMNISDDSIDLLRKKASYRNIQKVININFQSIRYTVLDTLKKIKNNIIIKEM